MQQVVGSTSSFDKKHLSFFNCCDMLLIVAHGLRLLHVSTSIFLPHAQEALKPHVPESQCGTTSSVSRCQQLRNLCFDPKKRRFVHED